jgi:hypothetical protein
MGRYLDLAKATFLMPPSSLIPLEARLGTEGIKGTEGVSSAKAAQTHAQNAPNSARCSSCGSSRFWRSTHGKTNCARCHPPAWPHLVAEWIELNGEITKVERPP